MQLKVVRRQPFAVHSSRGYFLRSFQDTGSSELVDDSTIVVSQHTISTMTSPCLRRKPCALLPFYHEERHLFPACWLQCDC
jgi:hypothetical protein